MLIKGYLLSGQLLCKSIIIIFISDSSLKIYSKYNTRYFKYIPCFIAHQNLLTSTIGDARHHCHIDIVATSEAEIYKAYTNIE